MLKTINQWFEKLNSRPLFTVMLIILIGVLGFGLGRLTKIEQNKMPVEILMPASTATLERGELAETTAPVPETTNAGQVIASKNGTKYHLPWCAGARNIKEENKIWFASAAAAKKAGYSPASNCPGLE